MQPPSAASDELVAPVRRGGEAEPVASRDLPDGILEGRCGDVVAFVSNDQSVACGQLADIGAPGQRLPGRPAGCP